MLVVCSFALGLVADEPERRVNLTVDATAKRHTISPEIYGTNTTRLAPNEPPSRFHSRRFGGNRWTAYNWKNNASNAGADWKHQNDGYLSESKEPGAAIVGPIDALRDKSTLKSVLVTVPIGPHLAADRLANGDVKTSGDSYLRRRFMLNSPAYQRRFVSLVNKACQTERGLADIRYGLDNEPDLWSHTHPRIFPRKAYYSDVIERNAEYAGTIKLHSPNSKVYGPAVSGWMGLTRLGDAPDAAKRDFTRYYLTEMKRESDKRGRRLVDAFDFHWYPEHRGGGVRVTTDDASPAVADARVQAPRSLYDPTFREDSWIVRDVLKEPIQLLPRLDRIRAETDPGIAFAVTEYYFGGGADISGAVAEADALGAFANQPGLTAAYLFHLGKSDDRFIHAAFDLFTNYDGKGGKFGSHNLRTTTDKIDTASVYAAADDDGTVTVVVCHRANAASQIELTVEGHSAATAKRFEITSAAAVVKEAAPVSGEKGKFRFVVSGRGVTLLAVAAK